VTLREQHRLKVFENIALRRISGSERDEIIRIWRQLHNQELHNLNFSLYIIRMTRSRRMRWEGHVTRMGEKKNAYGVLVGK
jgi:hypothetical protein